MSLHPARPKSVSATGGIAIAGRCLGSDGNQHIGPAFRVGVLVPSSIELRKDKRDMVTLLGRDWATNGCQSMQAG